MLPMVMALAEFTGVGDAMGDGVEGGAGVLGAVFWGLAVGVAVPGAEVVTALVTDELPQLLRAMAMPVQPAHPKRVKTVVSHAER